MTESQRRAAKFNVALGKVLSFSSMGEDYCSKYVVETAVTLLRDLVKEECNLPPAVLLTPDGALELSWGHFFMKITYLIEGGYDPKLIREDARRLTKMTQAMEGN
jgi:hypothetical protein